MEKDIRCILCPLGCSLHATIEQGTVTAVSGQACGKGKGYARQEAVFPLRVVTSLMRAANRDKPFSVKTAAPIPKVLIGEAVREIFSTRPQAPLRCGEPVIKDLLGLGIDVVATQDVP
jgi:CxxC motif-containing protein